MILINLLPHREAARKKRQDIFHISLGAAAMAGGLIAGIVFLWIQGEISAQERRNSILTQEIQRLDSQIKDILALESEIAALRARQQAVENLQADRNMPVYLLSELTRQLPEGAYITGMQQNSQLVTVKGTAQSNERVSELLRNLAYRSPWFSKPELVEIVAGTVKLTPVDQRRVANFTIRVHLLRASEVKSASEGPAPGGAPQASKPGK